MFSTVTNILQLTSLMVKWGISQAVVCPGSRNAAIVHNLRAAGLECFNITDERSAGFFALGLIDANGGKPVAVCVTSGSAVLNLAPAVSEAYYRSLPLFVITADRPQRWIGQMDGQTLPQSEVFGKMVALSVTLPEPKDEEEMWHSNRLINEAMIAQCKTSRPVHINVPITEPMFDFSASALPDERMIRWNNDCSSVFNMPEEMKVTFSQADKVMLIVGQMTPEAMKSCGAYMKLLANAGCVVLAENLSNIHTVEVYPNSTDEIDHFYVGNFDQMLSAGRFVSPELVVTLGGHIVSKRLKQYLRKNPPLHHWHVSPQGEVADLFMCCTDVVETSPSKMLQALCSLGTTKGADYRNEMLKLSAETAESNDEMGENIKNDALTILKQTLSGITPGWNIHVANSSMVRNLQKVFSGSNAVYCNRGVNGIEGSISAAVGFWAGKHTPTLVLTGDLSFFYDQNALWNNYVKSPQAPLRILILNNSCGDIFHHLPGLSSPYLEDSIAAHHVTSAEGVAIETGAQYQCVDNIDRLCSVLPQFLSEDSSVAILEVRLC